MILTILIAVAVILLIIYLLIDHYTSSGKYVSGKKKRSTVQIIRNTIDEACGL